MNTIQSICYKAGITFAHFICSISIVAAVFLSLEQMKIRAVKLWVARGYFFFVWGEGGGVTVPQTVPWV